MIAKHQQSSRLIKVLRIILKSANKCQKRSSILENEIQFYLSHIFGQITVEIDGFF